MSHPSDIESRRVDPNGLQEIRSWASRSPGSERPGFRTRSQPGGFRLSTRLVGSLGLAFLILLVLTGYRSLQSEPSKPGPTALPQPQKIAASVPVPEPPRQKAETAIPATEAVLPDSHPVRTEPLRVQDIRPARQVRAENPREEAVLRKASKASQVVMSPDVFESEPAVLLSTPAAAYPDDALGTGTSAEVIVGFTIDETGAVRNPTVESSRVRGSASEALFEEAALAAARQARFAPARERGVPARTWSTLTFSFEAESPL